MSQRDGSNRRNATSRRFPPHRRHCPPAPAAAPPPPATSRDTRGTSDVWGPGGPASGVVGAGCADVAAGPGGLGLGGALARWGPARRAGGVGAQVPYVLMRPGVMGRPKPSSEAEQQYKADVELAGRRGDLLGAAREAESRFRQAPDRNAPGAEGRRPGQDPAAAPT